MFFQEGRGVMSTIEDPQPLASSAPDIYPWTASWPMIEET